MLSVVNGYDIEGKWYLQIAWNISATTAVLDEKLKISDVEP